MLGIAWPGIIDLQLCQVEKKKGIIISLGLAFVSCAPVCVRVYNFFFFFELEQKATSPGSFSCWGRQGSQGMGSPVEGLAAREAVPAEEQSAAGDALRFGEPPQIIENRNPLRHLEGTVHCHCPLPSQTFIYRRSLTQNSFFACPKLMGSFQSPPPFFSLKSTDKWKTLGRASAVRSCSNLK